MVKPLRAHDLVRIDPVIATRWPNADAWVAASLARAPWAVVRRERAQFAVSIGIRGAGRSERYAASIAPADVYESMSPFHCLRGAIRNDRLASVFARLTEFALARRLRVGAIGSYGFELASGVCATHGASDLDVLVDASDAPLETLRALATEIDTLAARSGVPIDVELAYAAGGAALREVLAGRELVLFKTDRGPTLLPCPV